MWRNGIWGVAKSKRQPTGAAMAMLGRLQVAGLMFVMARVESLARAKIPPKCGFRPWAELAF